jgi:uncharacterized membrane protein YecN with MAPEG domain
MPIHATLVYAGILGLLLVILSFNIVHNWVRVTSHGQQTDRAMRRAERVLSSFVEYAPFGLILLGLIELKGGPLPIVHVLGQALVFGRVLHACGSNDIPAANLMRFVGAQLTFVMLAIASLACLFYFVMGHI